MNAVPPRLQEVEVRQRGPSSQAADELGPALARGLGLPLTALRASIESLREALSADSPGHHVASNVLQEVDRLNRNLRDLLDYASSPRPTPSRCTASEIALSARGALPESARARVTLARERTDATLRVDGPLLTRNVQRLLERALDEGSEEILLVVRQERGSTVFSVIGSSSPRARSSRPRSTGLALSVARRDVETLQGTLEIRRSPSGETCATVILPDSPDGDAS